MHRRPLLELLRRYQRRNPDETAVNTRFRDFVTLHETCFERSLLIGHVTGSAWLVDSAGERVLLTHHRKLGRWLQLGGHSDGDPDVLQVALREAREESSLQVRPVHDEVFDLDIHEIPARGPEPAHHHYDVRFALQVEGSESFAVSSESHDLAWVPIHSLADYTDEDSMLRMARKWHRRFQRKADSG